MARPRHDDRAAILQQCQDLRLTIRRDDPRVVRRAAITAVAVEEERRTGDAGQVVVERARIRVLDHVVDHLVAQRLVGGDARGDLLVGPVGVVRACEGNAPLARRADTGDEPLHRGAHPLAVPAAIRRIHQDESLYEVGTKRRDPRANRTAQRMADQSRRADTQRVDDSGDVRRVRRDLVSTLRLVALAVTAQIDREDVPLRMEMPDHEVPGAPPTGDAVHDDQRRATRGPVPDAMVQAVRGDRQSDRFHGEDLPLFCRGGAIIGDRSSGPNHGPAVRRGSTMARDGSDPRAAHAADPIERVRD